jgi:miniconductance mechanosensitive channel
MLNQIKHFTFVKNIIFMDKLQYFFFNVFIDLGVSNVYAKFLNMLTLLVITIIIFFTVDIIVRKFLRFFFINLARKTHSTFDDLLIRNKVPRNIAHIIPLIVVITLIPIVFKDYPFINNPVEKILHIFIIISSLWIIRSLLNTIKDYLKTLKNFKNKPIDSYIQVFMIFAWIGGVLFTIAYIGGLEPKSFLTGLGAVSAIIILIFKDTILGFVASIQVSINDMVRIGDWVTFEKFGADGDVIEINLATVKVQNFDMTITTIPTYALISDSFKNWRGMEKSGGRRIKRSIFVNMSSIKYLTDEKIEDLKKIHLITDYLNTKQKEVNTYNTDNDIDKSIALNGRNLTNVGVFRKYIETYINKHSGINKKMFIMTRHLQPTTQGLPIEIYAFSKDKRWENYEYIMADIFDHILASVHYFDIEIFELPNSQNFKI